jgi:hypothetical protein
MRARRMVATWAAGMLLSSLASAQVGPGDTGQRIAFANSVPDICFPVARGTSISRTEAAKWQLTALSSPPAALNGMYPMVAEWFALNSKPDNIFVGVGDAPGRCHIVLANSKASREAYAGLAGLLRATGFRALEDGNGRALTLFVRKTPTDNMLILLKSLTDAEDGIGPQVSVDVSAATDTQLRSLLGRQ